MIWTDSPSWITCWNDGNQFIQAMRDESIEFIFAQHPWIENDALFADVILPVNTKLEEDDIGSDIFSGQLDLLYPQPRCVEPLGESFSDYEIVCKIAERLGMLEEYTGGMTVPEIIRDGYEHSGLADKISWEELNQKGYYVVSPDPEWEEIPAGLIEFYEDPQKHPLSTPTGKVEFYSTGLAEHFPDDPERPPVPHWIPEGSVAPGDHRYGEVEEVSLVGHEQPPPLGRALPARRRHLVSGDRDLQDPRPTGTSTTRCG